MNKAIEEDATVFEYDEVYESISENKSNSKSNLKSNMPNEMSQLEVIYLIMLNI